MGRGGGKQVSNLVFYAQSTSTVISGRGKTGLGGARGATFLAWGWGGGGYLSGVEGLK